MIELNNEKEENFVDKIENGEELTPGELRELVFDYEVESQDGDRGRWTTHVKTIVELCGRYFAIGWEKGLTEMQENEFYEQPYEVKKVEEEKVVKVTKWIKKDKDIDK